MSNYRLFIAGEEIDLNAKTKIALSRKVFGMNDLSERGIRFTNAFVIPPTAKNLRLLGVPSILASNNNAFEVSKPYTLNDLSGLVSSGRVIVSQFDEKKGIKIQLSEGVDFWDKVGALNLHDLNLHSDDFLFNNTNMNALKAMGSSVFLTALHDARGDKTNTALTNYNYTRPFYRFRILMDKIADQVGYKIDYGNVLTNTELNNTGCASNADRFLFSDYKIRFQEQIVTGTVPVGSPTSTIFNLGNILEGSDVLTNFIYKSSYVLKGTITAEENAVISFVFSDRTEKFTVPKGQSQINFFVDESEKGTTLEIRTNVSLLFEDVYFYDTVSESEIFDVDNLASGVIGFYALADYNLPNMTAKSFIKMIMSLFFLNHETDNLNKIIRFTLFSEELNTNNFTDLSGRVQRNNLWSSGGIYGKINYMGYSNDSDIDEDLGRATFRVENINAEDEVNVIQINHFSASKEVVISNERVVSYPIYDTSDVKRESVANRIVFFDFTGAFGYNATFSEISFQRLKAKYYFNFIENTIREREIEFEVLLRYNEFVAIEDKPLIFNPDQGGLFLVNDIEDFTIDGLTKLKCVKYG